MDEFSRAAGGLMAAAALGQGAQFPDVTALGERYAHWVRHGSFTLEAWPLTYEQGSGLSVPTQVTTEGDRTMATMTDTQQVVVGVQPEDSKGDDTTDSALTWSSDDNGAVVALQPAADGMSCLFVANQPGTANYSVTDGTLSGGGTIVVTPGAATQLVVSEGTPSDQAPAGG